MTVIGHNHLRKVDSFEGFEILAHPIPRYEDRVFHRGDTAVTYGSHDLMIARPAGPGNGNTLAILMHHGGGRYVLQFYEGALPIAAVLLALPEREQYALAYMMFKQADECGAGARASEANYWATAFVDGRIRKRRRHGKHHIFVETPAEKALRQG